MALTKTPQERRAAIDAALSEYIPPEVIEQNLAIQDAKPYKPTDKQLVNDSEEDYRFTRDSVKKLIETSNEAIQVMFALASDCENPRAFEVLANMLKSTADMNNQLIVIQKERKKMNTEAFKRGETPPTVTTNNTTNNIVFSGPTADLQKFLANRKTDENTSLPLPTIDI